MVEKKIVKYCEHCKKETVQMAREDALEIEYRCTECETEQDVVKTFF
ncbi:ribosomal protein L44E [Peribacillus deserti]|uniref:Ribosomal protein L44E n=1 Tax=Peribacillus deserti TaxID=673318 RepID=A0ABS2QID6_9BACI|nr:hypothetical protein [Peribacillus deserti]MBM7692912.1 ribosomal protein L44E [Peribacillus deserti]